MRIPSQAQKLAELRARLALWRCKGIGPVLFSKLLQQWGSATAVLSMPASQLNRLPPFIAAALKAPDWRGADQDLQWLAQRHDHAIVWADHWDAEDPLWLPPLLLVIAQAPPLLFVKGDPACLCQNQLAMVGSRRASAYGLSVAFELASQLAACGILITSGLALGIDSECQRGALAVGGKSIGVLAVGADAVYPKAHQALAEQVIATGGALLSEFPTRTPPLPHHFPRRNRLISGLSAGVVVVEAALKSGSLITAAYAADQGREVFAVPGSIRQTHFQGCHALIKDGAYLVEHIGDIQAVLPTLFSQELLGVTMVRTPILSALTEAEQALLAVLEDAPLMLDEIQMRHPLKTEELSALLTTLTLKGYLSQTWAGFSRVV